MMDKRLHEQGKKTVHLKEVSRKNSKEDSDYKFIVAYTTVWGKFCFNCFGLMCVCCCVVVLLRDQLSVCSSLQMVTLT